MADANPYTAPKAKVAGAPSSDAHGEVRILTSSGRIGRLRYIAYTVGLPMLVMMLVGLLGGLIGGALGSSVGSTVVLGIMGIGYIVVFVIVIMLTIQRCHDMDKSGWLALLLVIPLVNVIFWFIPGTDGENRFGLKPPPNGAGVILLALALPLVFIIGIVAAVALPAYQDYVKRANVQQTQ